MNSISINKPISYIVNPASDEHKAKDNKNIEQKIRSEISSGKYGEDIKKCMGLLDNASKDSLENAADIIKKTLEETNAKLSKTEHPGVRSVELQKQYEAATQITWMLRAENKRISQEIEEYRRKKDHMKVASLTQLRNDYNRIIGNLSKIVVLINDSTDDNFDEDKIKG